MFSATKKLTATLTLKATAKSMRSEVQFIGTGFEVKIKSTKYTTQQTDFPQPI